MLIGIQFPLSTRDDRINDTLNFENIYCFRYGTQIAKPSSRASTLARIDGFEVIGKISGTLLSPIILKKLNARFNYGFKLISMFLAIIYVILRVKGPPKSNKLNRTKTTLGKSLIQPLIDMFNALFTKRPNKLHCILAIQYLLYCIWMFSVEEELMRYLYLQKVLDGFDGTDFAYLTVFITSINSIGLLIILPILSHKLKLHDSAIQFWVLFIECIGMYSKLYNYQTLIIF